MAWLGGLNSWFQGDSSPDYVPQPATAEPAYAPSSQGQAPSTPFNTSLESGGYNIPGGTDIQSTPTVPAAAVALEVTALAHDRLKKSWKAFKDENKTMVQVWQSIASVQKGKGDSKGKGVGQELQRQRDDLQRSIQEALAASQRDATRAVETVRSLVSSSARGQDELWNHATAAAAQNVLKADQQSKHCTALTRMLGEADAAPPTAPPATEKNKEMLTLLTACELGSKSLESRVRQALGMERTKEEKKKASDEQQKTLISQIVAAANVSHDRAKRALDNTGGDPDSALVMLLSERESAAMKAEETSREKAEKSTRRAEKAIQDKAAEAKKAAMTIGSLACSTQKMAWAQVQMEFEAQLNVWQTQSLLRASTGGRSTSYMDPQREIEGVLATASREPSGAALLLEHALQNTVDSGLELCAGMLVAADGVLDADHLGQKRRNLAAKLHEVSKALEAGRPVGHNENQSSELSALVSSCRITDSALASRVQKLLEPGNVLSL